MTWSPPNKTSIVVAIIFLTFMVVGTIMLVKSEAQTASTTLSEAATSTPPTPPADLLPVITASVHSANQLHPTTIYAGLRSYITLTISDDHGIVSGGFGAPGMKYNGPEVVLFQCSNGVRTCSEAVYVIVPASPGPYTITVRATDTAGQTSTFPVSFTAASCSSDTECGGTYFPSSGATFCGPYGADLMTDRMKFQIKSVCEASACNERTEPGVLEDCASMGKICGFAKSYGGQFQCVPNPGRNCAIGSAITTSCICGSQAYEYYGYCCEDSQKKPFHITDGCPPPASPSPTPQPPPPPQTHPWSPSTTPTTTPASSPPTTSYPTPGTPPPASPPTPPPTLETLPAPTLTPTAPQSPTSTPAAAPPVAATSTPEAPAEPIKIRPLTRSELRALKAQTREMTSQIQQIERTVKKIEKSRLTIDPNFKTVLAQAKDALRRMKTVTDSGALREASEDLADMSEGLHAYLPRLDQLARTPEAVRIITLQISEAARIQKNTLRLTRRLKLDSAAQTEQMADHLAAMREALTLIKTASVETDDLFDYIQENVSFKLDAIRNLADQIAAITNIKKYVRDAATRAKQYRARITRREKNGDDMTDARALAEQFSDHLEALQHIATQSLTPKGAEEAIAHLSAMTEFGVELEDELSFIKSDELEEQLERLFLQGSTLLKKFELSLPD